MTDKESPLSDIYTLLGVSQMSPMEGVRTRFYKLTRLIHRELAECVDIDRRNKLLYDLKFICIAYDILSDPVTRTDYDLRTMGLRGVSMPQTPEEKKPGELGQRLHLKIGELLNVAGLLEASELEIACDMHKAMPEMQFGSFLVKQGFIEEYQLEAVLFAQKLLRKGLITVVQYQAAMEELESSGVGVAETVVERGYVTQSDLDHLEEVEAEAEAELNKPVETPVYKQPPLAAKIDEQVTSHSNLLAQMLPPGSPDVVSARSTGNGEKAAPSMLHKLLAGAKEGETTAPPSTMGGLLKAGQSQGAAQASPVTASGSFATTAAPVATPDMAPPPPPPPAPPMPPAAPAASPAAAPGAAQAAAPGAAQAAPPAVHGEAPPLVEAKGGKGAHEPLELKDLSELKGFNQEHKEPREIREPKEVKEPREGRRRRASREQQSLTDPNLGGGGEDPASDTYEGRAYKDDLLKPVDSGPALWGGDTQPMAPVDEESFEAKEGDADESSANEFSVSEFATGGNSGGAASSAASAGSMFDNEPNPYDSSIFDIAYKDRGEAEGGSEEDDDDDVSRFGEIMTRENSAISDEPGVLDAETSGVEFHGFVDQDDDQSTDDNDEAEERADEGNITLVDSDGAHLAHSVQADIADDESDTADAGSATREKTDATHERIPAYAQAQGSELITDISADTVDASVETEPKKTKKEQSTTRDKIPAFRPPLHNTFQLDGENAQQPGDSSEEAGEEGEGADGDRQLVISNAVPSNYQLDWGAPDDEDPNQQRSQSPSTASQESEPIVDISRHLDLEAIEPQQKAEDDELKSFLGQEYREDLNELNEQGRPLWDVEDDEFIVPSSQKRSQNAGGDDAESAFHKERKVSGGWQRLKNPFELQLDAQSGKASGQATGEEAVVDVPQEEFLESTRKDTAEIDRRSIMPTAESAEMGDFATRSMDTIDSFVEHSNSLEEDAHYEPAPPSSRPHIVIGLEEDDEDEKAASDSEHPTSDNAPIDQFDEQNRTGADQDESETQQDQHGQQNQDDLEESASEHGSDAGEDHGDQAGDSQVGDNQVGDDADSEKLESENPTSEVEPVGDDTSDQEAAEARSAEGDDASGSDAASENSEANQEADGGEDSPEGVGANELETTTEPSENQNMDGIAEGAVKADSEHEDANDASNEDDSQAQAPGEETPEVPVFEANKDENEASEGTSAEAVESQNGESSEAGSSPSDEPSEPSEAESKEDSPSNQDESVASQSQGEEKEDESGASADEKASPSADDKDAALAKRRKMLGRRHHRGKP